MDQDLIIAMELLISIAFCTKDESHDEESVEKKC